MCRPIRLSKEPTGAALGSQPFGAGARLQCTDAGGKAHNRPFAIRSSFRFGWLQGAGTTVY
jgi:hypothetical protein